MRYVWKRERPAKQTVRTSDLTPEEQENVKRALRVLLARLGSVVSLAEALKANARTLRWSYSKRGRPSGGIAIRCARLAGVPVDDVLTGAFPKPGACPHCGRSDA